MHSSQIVAILKTFSKKDIREFKKWLNSPFHNKREDVIILFKYLTKNEHLLKPEHLSKENVFKVIFPGENYDDAKIRQTIFFLLKNIEAYLSYNAWNNNPLSVEIALARTFRSRDLIKPFERSLKKIQKLKEDYPFRDAQFFQLDFSLLQERYAFLARKKRMDQTNLQEVANTLDKSYFVDKLKLACEMLSHKKLHKTEYDDGILNDVLNHIESTDILEVPAISIYYHIYKASTDEEKSEQYFFKLRESVVQFGHLFQKAEIIDILYLAINFCIIKMNQGQHSFVREAFELNKYGFENGILIENESIPKAAFNNVIRIASQLGEFNWAFQFIENFSQYLQETDRDNIVHFCKAKIFYAQERYDASMEELMLVRETDTLLNLSAKHTLLKIYYKKDEYEVLESLIGSMNKYLNRKDIPDSYKIVYQSIINIMKKLIRVNPFNKDELRKLENEIGRTPYLPSAEKDWLTKQVQEMI